MKIVVEDIETGKSETYDYSDNNWRESPACMRNGRVHMWAPPKLTLGVTLRTSGRRWSLKRSTGDTE